MKIYRLYDNGTAALTTTDRLKALESLYTLYVKYVEKQDWFWMDEEELR